MGAILSSAAAWGLLGIGAAGAQEPPVDAEPTERTEQVATALINSGAAQLRVQYDWVPAFHDAPGQAHAIVFRPVIPFTVFGARNVARVTLPYVIDGPQDLQGVGTVQIFDLVVTRTAWGAHGVGAVLALEPLSAEPGRASVGPALGAMGRVGRWTFGAFNQNVFGRDTAVSALLPVVGYRIDRWISVSTGNMQIAFDWERTRFVYLPISAQVNVVPVIADQAVQLEFNPQYNLIREDGSIAWVLSFGVAFILPSS